MVFSFTISIRVCNVSLLACVASHRTMVVDSPSVFRPFLQEFFVKASDPLFTCTLKLDVLTALVTEDNCATILGELQTYVLHRDKSFVCAAVRAVGRVADARPEAAEQCLNVRVLERIFSAAMRQPCVVDVVLDKRAILWDGAL